MDGQFIYNKITDKLILCMSAIIYKNIKKILFLIIIFISACSDDKVIYYPPIYKEPIQTVLDKPFFIEHDTNYQMQAVAKFEIEAKILSTKRYNVGKESIFSPIDLAVGWNIMSEEKMIKEVEIIQAVRFYSWKIDNPQLFSKVQDIIKSSANIHIIPQNDTITNSLYKLKKGENVYLKGYLVNIKIQNQTWYTSLTRTDTGGGACEIFFVEEIIIKN